MAYLRKVTDSSVSTEATVFKMNSKLISNKPKIFMINNKFSRINNTGTKKTPRNYLFSIYDASVVNLYWDPNKIKEF